MFRSRHWQQVSWPGPKRRRQRRLRRCLDGLGYASRSLGCALCCGLAIYAARAQAQSVPDLPSWVQLDAALPVNRDTLDSRWNSVVHTPDALPDYALATPQGHAAWAIAGRAAGFVDLSPTLGSSQGQAYIRPQFALGGESNTLRSWMRLAGIDAAACIAPLMRMHSGVAGGNTRANVSVSARCTIH